MKNSPIASSSFVAAARGACSLPSSPFQAESTRRCWTPSTWRPRANPFYIEEVCKSLLEEDKICFEHGRWVVRRARKDRDTQSVTSPIQGPACGTPPRAAQEGGSAWRLLSAASSDFNVLQHASDIRGWAWSICWRKPKSSQIISELQRSRAGSIVFSFYHALIPTTLRKKSAACGANACTAAIVAAALEEIHPKDYETSPFTMKKPVMPNGFRQLHPCCGTRHGKTPIRKPSTITRQRSSLPMPKRT